MKKKTNLNLLEAMEWVKKGYCIRRNWWRPIQGLAPAYFTHGNKLCDLTVGWCESFAFTAESITARIP